MIKASKRRAENEKKKVVNPAQKCMRNKDQEFVQTLLITTPLSKIIKTIFVQFHDETAVCRATKFVQQGTKFF